MNAREAREKARKILDDRSKKQYSLIKKNIYASVDLGEFFTVYYDDICDEVLELLKQEGYQVTQYKSGNNEYAYNIKW